MSTVSAITTHVLDTARGAPAAGVPVRLERVSGENPGEIGRASTDADGRVRDIGPERLGPGTYRLVFDVAGYLAGLDQPGQPDQRDQRDQREAFFPEVAVTFTADGEAPHYHIPLLLSPFGYATYRGS
jgi:5-hydroxyisourate hydrolase